MDIIWGHEVYLEPTIGKATIISNAGMKGNNTSWNGQWKWFQVAYICFQLFISPFFTWNDSKITYI